MLKLVRVSGRSMSPALEDGDLVVLVTGGRSLAAGDVACFRHPDLGLIVKRISAIGGDPPRYRLGSENALGSESDHLGDLPASAIVGRAVLRLTPLPRRIGRASGHEQR